MAFPDLDYPKTPRKAPPGFLVYKLLRIARHLVLQCHRGLARVAASQGVDGGRWAPGFLGRG
jgi:hypothetical protein